MPDFDAAELKIIARLVLKEHVRLESMLDGLSDDASDRARARLEPEMARLSVLYNKAS